MKSSIASVTWTPQNGFPMHPIFNSVHVKWQCKVSIIVCDETVLSFGLDTLHLKRKL